MAVTTVKKGLLVTYALKIITAKFEFCLIEGAPEEEKRDPITCTLSVG
jgi:hypothetical protein